MQDREGGGIAMSGENRPSLGLLVQNLCTQQELSWQEGENTPVERFLEIHSELAQSDEALLDLIYNEIVLREEHGEDVSPDEYYRRFPSLAQSLHNLWEIHEAIDDESRFFNGDHPPTQTLDLPRKDQRNGKPGDRSEAQALHVAKTDVLLQAPGETPTQAGPSSPENLLGCRLGDYELLDILGRGGMGVVYRARQISLDRIVALKMIRSGEWASPQEVQRFFDEARAVAKLCHPHIVAIHEVGTVGSQNYFSMDCIEGPTLAVLVRDRPLPAKRAAAYLLQIARAIDYAHQQGILHRDLKPSNFLLDSADQVHVTDFGLAKRVDAQMSIEEAAIVGTPSYMSPEQIDSSFGKVGPASDVYSLGAVLYELIVGHPPFLAATPMETMMQVVRGEHLSPRLVNESLHRDIDTICGKCLDKEPRRRYASAGELADDLQRFLDGDPILARPISNIAKLWRACKKKPGLSTAITLVVILLFVIAIANSWNAAKQKSLLVIAEQHRALAERQLRISTAQRLAVEAQAALLESPPRALLLASESLHVSVRSQEPHVPLAEQVLRDLLFQVGGPPLSGFRGRAQIIKFSPDSRWIVATGDTDNDVRLWDGDSDPTRTVPQLLRRHKQQISAVRFSPNGAWLVTADWGGVTCLWNLSQPTRPPIVLPECPTAIYTLAISPDSRWLVTAGNDRFVRLWSLDRTCASRSDRVLAGHNERITSVAIRGDSRWLATTSADGTVCLWDLSASDPSSPPRVLKRLDPGSLDAHFSPDGRWLMATSRPDVASPDSDSALHLWDLSPLPAEPKDIVLSSRESPICLADISSDGRWLVTVGLEGVVRLWDLRAKDIASTSVRLAKQDSGVVLATISPDSQWLMLLGDYAQSGSGISRVRLWKLAKDGSEWWSVPLAAHTQTVWQAAFDPKNRWLITTSADHTAALWDLCSAEPSDNAVRLLGHEGSVDQLVVSPNGRWCVTGSTDDTLRLWDLYSPKSGSDAMTLRAGSSPVRSITLSSCGRWLLACDSHAGYLWDLKTKVRPQLARTLNDQRVPINTALFSRDGLQLVTASENGKVTLLNLADPIAVQRSLVNGDSPPVNDISISRDRRWLATAGEDHLVRLVGMDEGSTAVRVLSGNQDSVLTVDFNYEGTCLASGGQDRTVRLWKTMGDAMQKPVVVDTHAAGVFLVRFSADNRWLISGSLDGSVHLTDLTKIGPPASPIVLNEKESHLESICVAVDGRWLAATDDEGTVCLWDLTATDPRKSVRKLYGQPTAHATLGISTDSHWIAVGSEKGEVHLWNLNDPAPKSIVLRGYGAAISMIAFSADSRQVIAASQDGSVRLWNLYLEELLDQAAHLGSRNFSISEWRKTFSDRSYQKTFDSLPEPSTNVELSPVNP